MAGPLYILVILLGIYDIYFRRLSLIEMAKWTGIGLLLNVGGNALMILIEEKGGGKGRDSEDKMEWQFFKELLKKEEWHQLIILIVIREELIFRGPLLVALLFLECPALLWPFIIIIDGIVFGLFHFKQDSSLFGFFSRSWAGIILSWLVIKSGSLFPSICVHLLWTGSLWWLLRWAIKDT